MRIEKHPSIEYGLLKQHETGDRCGPVMYKLSVVEHDKKVGDTWAELTVNGRKIHDMSTGIAVVRAMGMYTEIKMVTPSGTYYMDTY